MSGRGSTSGLHVVVDGGIDDALALAVLIGAGVPAVQVFATEGSRPLEQTALTPARILACLGSAIPVRLGAASALTCPYPEGRDPFHGEDCFAGLCDTLPPAEQPTEPYGLLDGPILATGALTVPAAAVAAGEPVGVVTWMGGSVAHGGDMTASAEFNAWMDPDAVDRLGVSAHLRRMVPPDITMRFGWADEDIQILKRCSPAGALIGSAAEVLCWRDGFLVPHDAVVAAAVIDPGLFRWVPRRMRCETTGLLTRGETIVDRRPHTEPGPTLVAEDVDASGSPGPSSTRSHPSPCERSIEPSSSCVKAHVVKVLLELVPRSGVGIGGR